MQAAIAMRANDPSNSFSIPLSGMPVIFGSYLFAAMPGPAAVRRPDPQINGAFEWVQDEAMPSASPELAAFITPEVITSEEWSSLEDFLAFQPPREVYGVASVQLVARERPVPDWDY